ncbi:alpha/beta hydrolase [uncultured Veillonella sp.]|uniref:alpha/beta hydrolase n=1 Tax=uncultured Veillonella sp. TaxID=159268 RepID=UPI00259A6127|nr:alpha/beta hydrolase [uncultured Veillonella sp.]
MKNMYSDWRVWSVIGVMAAQSFVGTAVMAQELPTRSNQVMMTAVSSGSDINKVVLSTPTGVVNETEGIHLPPKAKDTYILEKAKRLFHPAPNSRLEPFVVPEGWMHTSFQVGNVPMERLHHNKAESKRIVLQLHGGGYVLGMSDAHRKLGVKQALESGASDIYFVDYRLAPRHVYPSALEDAVTAYRHILETGIESNQVLLAGDSAGGNLALALAIYLKEHNMPQPGALLLASPWATMEDKAGTTRTSNATRDYILGIGTPLYNEVRQPSYVGTQKVTDYHVSPIYADLRGLPPILIQAGGNELFLTEDEELAKKAAADGVKVTLSVYPGMPHDFALLYPELEESVDSFQEIASFVAQNVTINKEDKREEKEGMR